MESEELQDEIGSEELSNKTESEEPTSSEKVEDKVEGYDYKHILRPNPDWEEDLMLHTIVTPELEKRIKSYTAKYMPKKPQRPPCRCSVPSSSPGKAPWLPLSDGRSIPSFGIGTWLGYSFSKDNKQVGVAIKKKIDAGVIKRSDIYVVTKLWNDSHSKHAVVPALKTSLHLLGLSYVDLYLIHWPVGFHAIDHTFDDIDFLETWSGMRDARAQGLTRSIGLSNFNTDMIGRIIALSPDKPAVLQTEINLNNQSPQCLRYCRENNICVMGFSPFGNLFHSRAAPDAPPPRASDRKLFELALKYKKTTQQIVLRYLWELGVIPIPKSMTKEHVEENNNIFDFRLTNKERAMLAEYDCGYRTIPATTWIDSPFYPFEREKYGVVEQWHNRHRHSGHY